MPRLKEIYFKEIQPALKAQFGYKNNYMGPSSMMVDIYHNTVGAYNQNSDPTIKIQN